MIKFHLPFPPSLNSLYPGKVRRHKSKKYEAWIREAGLMLLSQNRPELPLDFPVQVIYKFGRPDKRARDVFNLEKAVSDLLVAHGIIKDDTLIYRGTVEWADIDGCDITIEPFKTE